MALDQEHKIGREICLVLERLQEDILLTPAGEFVVYEVARTHPNPDYPSAQNQLKILHKLQSLGALKIVRTSSLSPGTPAMLENVLEFYGFTPTSFVLDILPQFEEIYASYSHFRSGLIQPSIADTTTFEVRVEDRKIFVNEFLLRQPHAAGRNMSFFEYVFAHPGRLITRDGLPQLIQDDVRGRLFPKTLNSLGFTGEVLKAFFPHRGKNELKFQNPVSKNDLVRRGIDIDLLFQELKLAHTKRSPK